MNVDQYLDALAEEIERCIPLVRSLTQSHQLHADRKGFGHETTVVLTDSTVLLISEQLRFQRSARSLYIKRNLHIESFSLTFHHQDGRFTRFDLDPTHQRHLASYPHHKHTGTTGPLPLFDPPNYGTPATALSPGDPRSRAEFLEWIMRERAAGR